MTNTETTARPATAILSDVELRAMIEMHLRTAEKNLATERAVIADSVSIVQAAEWNVKDAVVAEAKIAILRGALNADPERMRGALAYGIGSFLADDRNSDPFGVAVSAAKRAAGRALLRTFASEVDAAEVVARLS